MKGERPHMNQVHSPHLPPRDLADRKTYEREREQLLLTSSRSKLLYRLRGVQLTLNRKTILSGLNLDIEVGDFFFLIGPTGAGKTSLLHLLYGHYRPTFGQMELHQDLLQKRRFASLIHQDLKLFEELNVWQNLSLCFDPLLHQQQSQFKHQLEDYLKHFSLDQEKETPITRLSGGMKQKVAIIRSLLSLPDILLADEPSSHLDRQTTGALYEVLHYYGVKRKLTVLWATHNLELTKNFYGSILSLDRGQLVQQGKKA